MQEPGLYVHIPFCRNKCPYCAFCSIASTSLLSAWLEALKKEVSFYKGRFKRFDSLYLGGGTPTVLKTRELADIMDQLLTHFDFATDSEFTIEANPRDLTREKIKALKDLGFNRISLGIQSFDNHILSFLGRSHTVREAERALTALFSFGFENISVDLIYGFQGLNLKKWIDTLKRALAFQPEHLSCYQLTFEKQTLFARLKDKGIINPLSEKDQCAFFHTTSQFLEDNGYIHYEISSFARNEGRYSRHNCKYWRHIPYLGLGPSAHSFLKSKRWWNVGSVRKYCKLLESGKAVVEGGEDLTDKQLRLESISLGLRTKQGFALKPPLHDLRSYERLFMLQDSGFLRVTDGRVIPTRKGFLVADHLALHLA